MAPVDSHPVHAVHTVQTVHTIRTVHTVRARALAGRLARGPALLLMTLCVVGELAAAEPHWAFVPPRRPAVPEVSDDGWPRGAVDRFILARIEGAGLRPSPPAPGRTLLRRLHLDLTGLPPTAAQLEAFDEVARRDPRAALDGAVDRLLASPHFGERWARWWMDLAHYGDSDGYLTDQPRPVAWRWRAWVVEAFDRNLPFDRFTVEQLAGDLLPDATVRQRIATGFLRNTLSNREGGADLEEFRVLQVKDRTSTFGAVWLGLTLECAQCHDHKHDPISQQEFYGLYAFFNNADELNIDAPLPGEGRGRAAAKREYDERRRELLAPAAVELEALQRRWEARLLDTEAHPARDHHWDRELELLGLVWGGRLGEGQLEGIHILHEPWPERTPTERDRLQDYFLRSGSRIDPGGFEKLEVGELVKGLDELAKRLPPVTRAPTMVRHRVDRPAHVHIRGDFRRRGVELRPGTPAALHALDRASGRDGAAERGTSDRLALARWTVSPRNPLTARVTVNRLWQEIFGRGLVATADDFGTRGARPSHPLLLDWLATELVRGGWDVKAMLRLMVRSATYAQSSIAAPGGAGRASGVGGASRAALFARHERVRLSAELIRDGALAVSGLLDRRVGGPSVRPPQPASVIRESFEAKWPVSAGGDRYRRGLYTYIQRSAPFAQLVTFDFPENNRPCAGRTRSNTPLQALNLLNDPTFFEAARALAARVLREGGTSTRGRLDRAFLLCLARPPRPAERSRLEEYLATQAGLLEGDLASARAMAGEPVDGCGPIEQAAWVGVASILLNLDEFITKG